MNFGRLLLTSINVYYKCYMDYFYILNIQTQQVNYEWSSVGSQWKVVQKVQLRDIWDIPKKVDGEVRKKYSEKTNYWILFGKYNSKILTLKYAIEKILLQILWKMQHYSRGAINKRKYEWSYPWH